MLSQVILSTLLSVIPNLQRKATELTLTFRILIPLWSVDNRRTKRLPLEIYSSCS